MSVVTPAYNRPVLLRATGESVLAQTWTDLEYVIAVNGGNAEVLRSAESLAAKDPRVRVLRIPRRGLFNALDEAFAAATGAYVAAISDDDLWDADFLRRTVEAMEGAAARPALAYTDHDLLTQAGPREWPCQRPFFEKHHVANLNSVLFDKTALDRVRARDGFYFDRRYVISGDWDLFARLARTGDPAVHIHAPLLHYRIHPGQSITSWGGVRWALEAISVRNRVGLHPPARELARGALKMVDRRTGALGSRALRKIRG